VVGRELIFSNSQIASLITDRFVAYAGDQWYLHRQKDELGTYFWKVAQQGHNAKLPEDATRQGIYVANAEGQLLASDHFRPHVATFVSLLERSLKLHADRPKGASLISGAAATDVRYSRIPPADGLILSTFTRIPLELPEGGRWTPNQAVGRDHMWLTRHEVGSLQPPVWKKDTEYPLPPAIAERLARFHLTDNVRGEPPMWSRGHIRELKISIRVSDPATGRLSLLGTARLESNDGKRGYDSRLQGELVVNRQSERVTRMDLLAWGEAWGEGPYTRGAPPGRFPLLVAFSLAGDKPADRVPPQGSREIQAYLGTGSGS
jgi:hypothetical protein